jgi:hypothetical protein
MPEIPQPSESLLTCVSNEPSSVGGKQQGWLCGAYTSTCPKPPNTYHHPACADKAYGELVRVYAAVPGATAAEAVAVIEGYTTGGQPLGTDLWLCAESGCNVRSNDGCGRVRPLGEVWPPPPKPPVPQAPSQPFYPPT